jgi:hypothetical protein
MGEKNCSHVVKKLLYEFYILYDVHRFFVKFFYENSERQVNNFSLSNCIGEDLAVHIWSVGWQPGGRDLHDQHDRRVRRRVHPLARIHRSGRLSLSQVKTTL